MLKTNCGWDTHKRIVLKNKKIWHHGILMRMEWGHGYIWSRPRPHRNVTGMVVNVKVGISIGISEVRIVWNGGEELVVVDLLQVTEQCKIGMFIGLPHMTGHSTRPVNMECCLCGSRSQSRGMLFGNLTVCYGKPSSFFTDISSTETW